MIGDRAAHAVLVTWKNRSPRHVRVFESILAAKIALRGRAEPDLIGWHNLAVAVVARLLDESILLNLGYFGTHQRNRESSVAPQTRPRLADNQD